MVPMTTKEMDLIPATTVTRYYSFIRKVEVMKNTIFYPLLSGPQNLIQVVYDTASRNGIMRFRLMNHFIGIKLVT